MSLPKDDAAELAARWRDGVLLKRDVFSIVERGRFKADAGEVDGVLRRLDEVPWWSWGLALHLFSRERRALQRARDLDIGPRLLWAGRRALVRGFIDGVALHLAKPHGNAAYFRSARQVLHRLHRARICHNDLAKEQNWLVSRDGRAYLTDFQLAACFAKRSWLFRVAAYEDIRHMLKHKRSYAPEALTAKERKILARKSVVASVWLKTGKKVYQAITRGLFNFRDREGGGKRLVNDAPVLAELIRKNPAARCGGPAAHRDPAARSNEPARPDRADDAQRGRSCVPPGYPRQPQELARPLQFRGRPAVDVSGAIRRETPVSATPATMSTAC